MSRRNVQPVGEHLRALLDITIAAAESRPEFRSYGEYIHAADSCFMKGDYAGASRQFELAFATSEKPYGSHLYNSKEFSVLLDGIISDMKELGLQPPPSSEMQQSLMKWAKDHDEVSQQAE